MTRPKVIVQSSASVDGRIAVARNLPLLFGDPRWQHIEAHGGPNAFPLFDWLMSTYRPQATLEGSGSFIRDDDEPAPLPPFEGESLSLYDDFLPESVLNRPERRGWFAAVDGRGRIRWHYKYGYPDSPFENWFALVLVSRRTPPEYLAYLQREEMPYLVAGDGPVDLALALAKMGEKLGIECLLSTAGGRLNGALLRAGLVDEIYVEFLPAIIGGTDAPKLYDSPTLALDEMPTLLNLVWAQVQANGRIWLRYEVVKTP
jgi:2,5-diamino-6-(ribosylamino)-4(3H)-pyrimidinone 5'-phosphate reductase